MFIVSAALMLLGGFFDFITPLGVAAGITYVPFVLSAIWWRSPYTVFTFAALATFITIAAYFAITVKIAETWIVLANRVLSTSALWVIVPM